MSIIHHSRMAFSLMELSIVLVIIGLLTGGVLTGQSLIHSSELNSLAKDKQAYLSAINTFVERYKGLPGDISNATDIWGAAAASNALCAALDSTSPSIGTETCNGNGNLLIAPITVAGETYEKHHTWQQLVNAGLIPGHFTGVPGAGGVGHVVPGENSPETALNGGGWSLLYIGTRESDAAMFDGTYGHVLIAGGESTTSNTTLAFISAEDALGVDNKIDDGKPARGDIVTLYSAGATCHDASAVTDLDAAYNATSSGVACSLVFRNLF